MLAPYCDRDKRIVAARVSESALPDATQTYPLDKKYYARPDETPTKIAKMFGANLEVITMHWSFPSFLHDMCFRAETDRNKQSYVPRTRIQLQAKVEYSNRTSAFADPMDAGSCSREVESWQKEKI